jgi:putative hydrolase of HD superfamily
MTAMICFAISRIEQGLDTEKLITMALIHDLPEARTGDLNYVHKRYVTAFEDKASKDMADGLPFGTELISILQEFNEAKSREAILARDADQLSFIMELKKLHDAGGAKSPEKWLPFIIDRLKTDTGRKLAQSIMDSNWDDWWFKNYSE